MNTLGFVVSGADRLILSQHQHSGAWNQALDLGAHPVDNHSMLHFFLHLLIQ